MTDGIESAPASEQLGADWLEPDWPFADRIRVITTTRSGGVSRPPYDSFNLADHVGDDPDSVRENRQRLRAQIGHLPVQWLEQVHGTEVVEAHAATSAQVPRADGAWSAERGFALAILTADCLPIVIADRACECFAVIHGGWRGLVNGVLGQALAVLPGARHAAWIGPGIGPTAYEVGEDVIAAVRALALGADAALRSGARPGKAYLDLFTLARLQLNALGVDEVYCAQRCTVQSPELYSYRRDGETGRFATLAWLP